MYMNGYVILQIFLVDENIYDSFLLSGFRNIYKLFTNCNLCVPLLSEVGRLRR